MNMWHTISSNVILWPVDGPLPLNIFLKKLKIQRLVRCIAGSETQFSGVNVFQAVSHPAVISEVVQCG